MEKALKVQTKSETTGECCQIPIYFGTLRLSQKQTMWLTKETTRLESMQTMRLTQKEASWFLSGARPKEQTGWVTLCATCSESALRMAPSSQNTSLLMTLLILILHILDIQLCSLPKIICSSDSSHQVSEETTRLLENLTTKATLSRLILKTFRFRTHTSRLTNMTLIFITTIWPSVPLIKRFTHLNT